MTSVIIYCTLILLIRSTHSQLPALGLCPKVKVMENFDVTQFTGTWYLTASYPDKTMLDGRCAVTTFTLPTNAGYESYNESATSQMNVFKKFITFGKEKKYLGSASIVAAGVLGITFPASPKANAYYNILDTDYYNYCVIFTCDNYYGVANGQNLWIFGRRKFLEPQYVQATLSVLSKNGLSPTLLRNIDQGCDNPFPYPKA